MAHISTSVTRPGIAASRRRLRRGTALATCSAALLSGLLVACSASPAETDSSAAASDATIEFDYAGYSATLPADPARVVVLDSRAGLEMALLADYPIVATAFDDDSPLSPLVGADAAHLKNSAFELDREEIAAYDPDLIVVGSAWLGVYEDEGLDLDTIAPVLAVKETSESPTDDDFAVMVDQLEMLDRSAQAAEVVEGYESAVTAAREDMPAEMDGATISVIHLTTEGLTVISGEEMYQAVLPDLGFEILDNEVIQSAPPAPSGDNHALSYENALSALEDADLLLVYTAEEGMGFDPLLKRVPAIAEGRWIAGNLAERVGFALTSTSLVNGISAGIDAFPKS